MIKMLKAIVWNTGEAPNDCQLGIVTPIHKSEDMENYRGITLLSTVGKLYPRVLDKKTERTTGEHFFKNTNGGQTLKYFFMTWNKCDI